MGFGKLYLTKVGQALQYKCQAGKTLNFLKFVLGSGELGSQAISELTGLIQEKMSISISKLKVTDTKVTLGISFNNANVDKGFYFREIGIIAEDPDTKEEILFMYGNAGDSADYIDSAGGDVLEKKLDVDIFILDVENITATLDSSLIYSTPQELEEAIAEVRKYVDDSINNIPEVDLTGYATEEFVNDAITAAITGALEASY